MGAHPAGNGNASVAAAALETSAAAKVVAHHGWSASRPFIGSSFQHSDACLPLTRRNLSSKALGQALPVNLAKVQIAADRACQGTRDNPAWRASSWLTRGFARGVALCVSAGWLTR